MVSTPIKSSAETLQKRLIARLERLPDYIRLTPLNGNKQPQGKDWTKRPFTPMQMIDAVKNGVEVPFENKSGEIYHRRIYPKGFGLMTGPVGGGILAVDFDGASALEKFIELNGGLPPKTEGFTSRLDWEGEYPDHFQLTFSVPQEFWGSMKNKIAIPTKWDASGKVIERLELRWSNMQSVLPPSIHPQTGSYRDLPNRALGEIDRAPCPLWIIEQMLNEPLATETPLLNRSSTQEHWTDIKWALSYLGALSPSRADDYDDWLAIGMALHSLGDDSLLLEWDDWSKYSPKYKVGECEKKWKSFKRQGVAIGTLAHMAKQDGWRSPFNKSTGRSFSGGIGSGGGRRGNGGSGGSGDGGDGDGGDRSKVVKHPSFNPISPEELEVRLNALVQEGLTGSKLTSKLNQLSELTGRHIIELRKQYLERVAELDQEDLREQTAQDVETLLEASTASLDLHSILPATLATPLLKLAGWLNLKPECYLTALLTAVSTLHKASTIVVLNKEWDFEVSPNLYSAIVAPSSQKKSPILKAICKKPLSLLQKAANEEYKHRMQSYEEELKQWEATKPEERGPAPEKPQRKIYYFTKSTGEGITYQAARCPEQGMLYLSDELAGMLGAQNQYRGGKGSDKQDLLTYYDGMGDVVLRADGIKSESDFVLLSILGGIQPKVIQKLLDDCSDSDGGWARFMLVNQPNAASTMKADGGNYDLTNLLSGLYQQIDALPATTYRLSPKAFRLFCNAYNSLEKKRVNERLEGMQAVWGKSQGRIGKLAVNLHVIHALMNGETPSEEIPVQIIQAAIILTKYYAQQVQSLYTQFSDPDALAPHLASVIQLAQRKGDWIKASDVYLSITKKHRPSGETVREWFGELVLMGKGEVKGEGRTLQFRIFSDKHPPTPPSSDPPSEKLDEIRQELDKSSNAVDHINQEVQEKLDKLDNLDDFQKTENPPVEVDEEELDDNQDMEVSPAEKNQFLDDLSNLSNNSCEPCYVVDSALDDLSKKSSNLDDSQKMVGLAHAPVEQAASTSADKAHAPSPAATAAEPDAPAPTPVIEDWQVGEQITVQTDIPSLKNFNGRQGIIQVVRDECGQCLVRVVNGELEEMMHIPFRSLIREEFTSEMNDANTNE